jgi:hypothetical protein
MYGKKLLIAEALSRRCRRERNSSFYFIIRWVHISDAAHIFFYLHSYMKSKGRTRDEPSIILASRDKHSVVRSFQESLIEDIKISQQRSSKHKVHKNEGDVVQIKPKALRVPFDADKLAKDAGGKFISMLCLCTRKIPQFSHCSVFIGFPGFPWQTSLNFVCWKQEYFGNRN